MVEEDAVAVVVLTRLEARGLRGAREVMRATGEVVADLAASPGFLGGRVLADRRLVFWTLTVWESPQSLRGFGPRHAAVAARVDEVARSARSTAWQEDDAAVPRWRDVRDRLDGCPPPALGASRSLPPSRVGVPA